MNSHCERLNRLMSAGFALVAAISWSVMNLADAYSHSLTQMDNSYNRGFDAIDLLDDITGALDRLALDQRVFLSTGEQQFVDGIWNSTVALDRDIATLNSFPATNTIPRAEVARLSAGLKQALKSVADCDEIMDARGRRAALAFFDRNDGALIQARSEAASLI
jgi:CHASE3 domain sensor protein